MGHRYRLALDAGDAGGGGVQQRVDQVVGEQVDLVDVQDPPMCAGKQPGLERPLAGQGPAQVQRADEAVERRSERQLDQRRRPLLARRVGRYHAVGR